jgi:hypothetical protein
MGSIYKPIFIVVDLLYHKGYGGVTRKPANWTEIVKPWETGHNITYWDQLTEWCLQTFGKPRNSTCDCCKWAYKSNQDEMRFFFRDAIDAEIFTLKWM